MVLASFVGEPGLAVWKFAGLVGRDKLTGDGPGYAAGPALLGRSGVHEPPLGLGEHRQRQSSALAVRDDVPPAPWSWQAQPAVLAVVSLAFQPMTVVVEAAVRAAMNEDDARVLVVVS